MKAIVINEFGNESVLKQVELETPKPQPGHVLIKILATGLNRFDLYIRAGQVAPELPFPHILGSDAAGEVAELGEGATGFSIGERVIPVPGFAAEAEHKDIRPVTAAPSFALPGLHRSGTYAQYISVPAYAVVKDNTGLPAEEIATLPVPLATGVRAVKVVGGVKAGDKVLIQAGNGAAGSMQIQIAKALGAEVATTVRSADLVEFAQSVGADLVIDTSKDDFVTKVKEWTDGQGADVVIDSLGGDVLPKSIDATRAFGTTVVFGFVAGTEATFNSQNFFFMQKTLKGSMASDKEDLEWGLEQVKAGKIKASLDRTFALRNAVEAHQFVGEGKVKGNVVLLPWSA